MGKVKTNKRQHYRKRPKKSKQHGKQKRQNKEKTTTTETGNEQITEKNDNIRATIIAKGINY